MDGHLGKTCCGTSLYQVRGSFLATAVLLVCSTTCVIATAGPLPRITTGDVTLRLTTVAAGLGGSLGGVPQHIPTDLVPVPDGSGRLVVATLGGLVRMIDASGNLLSTPFANTTNADTWIGSSFGMTSIAFHPGYASVGDPGYGKFYTLTTEQPNSALPTFSATAVTGSLLHDSVISEWTDTSVSDNLLTGDRREVIRIAQPDGEHNVNDLVFDGEGRMYIGVGDGGYLPNVATHETPIFGDNSPDLTKVFGKILRIDPLEPAPGDPQASANGAYRIPPGQVLPGALPEIYTYGHRNPYRLSFDRATGDLYTGDVGQWQIEEVNQVVQGGNYGWPMKEGTFLFDRTDGNHVAVDLDSDGNGIGDVAEVQGFREPVLQYDHDEGRSITGGFVYRGTAIPELQGKYVYSDLFGGNGIYYGDLATGVTHRARIDPNSASLLTRVISIGEDADGELYFLGHLNGDGRVLRLTAGDPVLPTDPGLPITQIDVFDAADPSIDRNRTGNLQPDLSIDDVLSTWGSPTPSGTVDPVIIALGYADEQQLVTDRLRVKRAILPDRAHSDVDGVGDNNDYVNMQILWTSDTGPLNTRTYVPVTGMVNGVNGAELVHAEQVNPDGTIFRNNHAPAIDGEYWSVTFDPVQATGLAIYLERDAADDTPYVHYGVYEYQAFAPILAGDYNDDGLVDMADYTVWRDLLGAAGATLANRDPAITGPVGRDDYAAWRTRFGTSAEAIRATGATARVPEPAAGFLLLFVLAATRVHAISWAPIFGAKYRCD